PGFMVSATACSVASARFGSASAGSTVASSRSATGSADTTRPPSPSAVARCRPCRRDSSPPTGLRSIPALTFSSKWSKLAILPWIPAPGRLAGGHVTRAHASLQPLVKYPFANAFTGQRGGSRETNEHRHRQPSDALAHTGADAHGGGRRNADRAG